MPQKTVESAKTRYFRSVRLKPLSCIALTKADQVARSVELSRTTSCTSIWQVPSVTKRMLRPVPPLAIALSWKMSSAPLAHARNEGRYWANLLPVEAARA